MPIVTIARETGAGGADVGRLLADRLGADPVDGSLIEEVAGEDEQPRSGNAVIVGRGACFVLADLLDAVHVFLCAPLEVRVRRLVARWGTDEASARRRLLVDDARRRVYVQEVHGREWRDPLNYDLAIDTGRVDFEEAAEAIALVAARR